MTRVLDAQGIATLVETFAQRVQERLVGASDVAVVGVRRGGVALAQRLAGRLRTAGAKVDVGTVDIALYRDDAHLAFPRPATGPTEILFGIDGRHVVLVDDVFWTGRSARAALDAVLDFGRPRRLWLATLVERPGRELPLVPDVVALALSPAANEKVELRLVEDGHPVDELVVVPRGKP